MRAPREIQIFNFAFLDILTSTLATLIFIFVMVLINQFGLVEHSELLKELGKAEKELGLAQEQAKHEQKKYENERDKTKNIGEQTGGDAQRVAKTESENHTLEGEIAQAETDRQAFQKEAFATEEELVKRAKQKVTQQGGKAMLPMAQQGTGAIPFHVDCTRTGLVILGEDVTSLTQRIQCSMDQIERTGSPYRQLLSRFTPRAVLVLWVRPDGIKTFEKALKLAKEAKIAVGYEPAEPDWSF